MTRKDYVAIAKAVSASLWNTQLPDLHQEACDSHNAGVIVTARNIADVMQADNPRFDRSRFLKACGVA